MTRRATERGPDRRQTQTEFPLELERRSVHAGHLPAVKHICHYLYTHGSTAGECLKHLKALHLPRPSIWTIYRWSSDESWTHSGKIDRPVLDAELDRQGVTPLRRCHECANLVRVDPCPFCGANWKRAA